MVCVYVSFVTLLVSLKYLTYTGSPCFGVSIKVRTSFTTSKSVAGSCNTAFLKINKSFSIGLVRPVKVNAFVYPSNIFERTLFLAFTDPLKI